MIFLTTALLNDRLEEAQQILQALEFSKTTEECEETRPLAPDSYYENLVAVLKQLGHFYFYPNPGNLGDVLISHGAYQMFRRLGLNYTVLKSSSSKVPKGSALVYGGGGLFTKYWGFQKERDLLMNRDFSKVVILPSSFFEVPQLVQSFTEKFTVFAREEKSFKYLKTMNKQAKIVQVPDMALSVRRNVESGCISERMRNNIQVFLKRSVP